MLRLLLCPFAIFMHWSFALLRPQLLPLPPTSRIVLCLATIVFLMIHAGIVMTTRRDPCRYIGTCGWPCAPLLFLTHSVVHFSYDIYISYIYHIFIYIFGIPSVNVSLFKIYLFHCNPEYYFFLLCIDVNKYIYLFDYPRRIQAYRFSPIKIRFNRNLYMLRSVSILWEFCACVFFGIKILIVIVCV
jgi:hypothetical protein